jgi:hypothetical protein
VGWGLRVEGSGFRVEGSGLRVQGSGFRVEVGAAGVHSPAPPDPRWMRPGRQRRSSVSWSGQSFSRLLLSSFCNGRSFRTLGLMLEKEQSPPAG